MQERGITSLTPPNLPPAGNIGFSAAFQNYVTSQNAPPIMNQIQSVSPNQGMGNLPQANFPYIFSTPRADPRSSFLTNPRFNNLSAFKQIIPPNTDNSNRGAMMQNQNKITAATNNLNLPMNNFTIATPQNFQRKESSSSPADRAIDPNSFSNCLIRNNNNNNNNLSLRLNQNKGIFLGSDTNSTKLNLFPDMNQLQNKFSLSQQQQQLQIQTPKKQKSQLIQTPFGGNSVINIKSKFSQNNSSSSRNNLNNNSNNITNINSNNQNQMNQAINNFASELNKLGHCQNTQRQQQLSSSSNRGNVQLTFEQMSKYVTQAISPDDKYK